MDVSKWDKGELAEVDHANKKEKHTITNELRKGVSSETFNMIVSGNIESLPNSAQVDMGWLMDTCLRR